VAYDRVKPTYLQLDLPRCLSAKDYTTKLLTVILFCPTLFVFPTHPVFSVKFAKCTNQDAPNYAVFSVFLFLPLVEVAKLPSESRVLKLVITN
jgi:hypothetical protein